MILERERERHCCTPLFRYTLTDNHSIGDTVI
jgi:hypothetical protein